jgi:ribonuclease J
MNLIIHRGTNEIGGSCIEIATNKSRVLIDIGLPLDFDNKTKEQKYKIKEQARNWCINVDAIFISHYHQDHHGLLSEVSPEMPVFVTRGTASMFKINSVFLPYKTTVENVQIISPATLFTQAIPVTIGDIKITAFTVDHSAYDACAFLIEVEHKRILYSGDIRLHGRKGILYKNLPLNVDYLILEGTNIEKNNLTKTEEEIEQEFVDLFNKKDDKLNFVWSSGQHIDRLTNIYKAAIKTHKILVVDVYIAATLYEIHKLNNKIPSPENHGIKVWYTHPLKYKVGETNYSLLFPNQRVRPIEIRNNPEKYVVVMRPSMLRHIRSNLNVSKANVITSMWKEYEKNEKQFFNWVDSQGYEKLHIHTSGHADIHLLKTIADYINPLEIIPIHTQKKEYFEMVFEQKIMLLEDNVSFHLN